MNNEEIPLLECEDAPGWFCLIHSRDDVVATKFGGASCFHDLPRNLGIWMLVTFRSW